MKKLIISMLLTVTIGYGLAFAQSSQAQDQYKSSQPTGVKSDQDQAGWQKIAEKTIDLNKGHDELALNNPEKFKAIRVKTENTAVDFTKVQLYYDCGEKQDLSINTPVNANSESQAINLKDTDHGLKKIVFDFKASNNLTSSGNMKNTKDMKSTENMKSDDNMKSSKDITSSPNNEKTEKVNVEVWGLRADISK